MLKINMTRSKNHMQKHTHTDSGGSTNDTFFFLAQFIIANNKLCVGQQRGPTGPENNFWLDERARIPNTNKKAPTRTHYLAKCGPKWLVCIRIIKQII